MRGWGGLSGHTATFPAYIYHPLTRGSWWTEKQGRPERLPAGPGHDRTERLVVAIVAARPTHTLTIHSTFSRDELTRAWHKLARWINRSDRQTHPDLRRQRRPVPVRG